MKDKNKESLQMIVEEIKQQHPQSKLKFNDNQLLTINGTKIEVSTIEIIEPKEKDDKKPDINELKILFKTEEGYVVIAEVNKDNEIMIDAEAMEKAKLSDKIRLNKDENSLELSEGEEKNKEKGEKEKPELDKEEENKDEKKEEIAKKYNVDSSQVIHISMDEKVTEDHRFEGLAKWARGYDDLYVTPGKDNYTWHTIGVKDKEETEIETQSNRQMEGKNPDVTIKRIDGEEITEVRPLAMYEIDDKSSYAIVRDSQGKPEMLYCRQEGGDEKTYWGSIVPEAEGKNVIQQEPEQRDFINPKSNSSEDLSKKAEELEKAKGLDERGVPSKEKGVQTYEINGTREQNRELMKEEIKEDLYKRKKIGEKMKGAMPGYLDYMEKQIDKEAKRIMQLMEENDEITYEEAVERIEAENSREAGGRTPDEGPRRRDD